MKIQLETMSDFWVRLLRKYGLVGIDELNAAITRYENLANNYDSCVKSQHEIIRMFDDVGQFVWNYSHENPHFKIYEKLAEEVCRIKMPSIRHSLMERININYMGKKFSTFTLRVEPVSFIIDNSIFADSSFAKQLLATRIKESFRLAGEQFTLTSAKT